MLIITIFMCYLFFLGIMGGLIVAVFKMRWRGGRLHVTALQNHIEITVPYLLMVAYLACAPFVVFLINDSAMREWIIQEGGPVETLSWLGCAACLLYVLYAGRWTFLARCWYIPLCFVFLGMRELDLDKKFTPRGILTSRFYTSADISLTDKMIGGVVIAIILFAVISLLRNHFKSFLKGLRQINPLQWTVLLGLGLAGFSKTIDGLARKLKPFGITLDEAGREFAQIAEEMLELGIPMVFMAAMRIYFNNRSSRSHTAAAAHKPSPAPVLLASAPVAVEPSLVPLESS